MSSAKLTLVSKRAKVSLRSYLFSDLFEEIRWIVENINPKDYAIVTPDQYVHDLLVAAYSTDVTVYCEIVPETNLLLLFCACVEPHWKTVDLTKAEVVTYHKVDMSGYTLIPHKGIKEPEEYQRHYRSHITHPTPIVPQEATLSPTKLSVGAVGLFMQDPEAFYIKFGLNMQPQYKTSKSQALQQFLHGFNVEIEKNWEMPFATIKAEWEKTKTHPIKTDVYLKTTIDDMVIEGFIDRIDMISPHSIQIIDYKLTPPPTKKQLQDFIFPELYILAYLAYKNNLGNVAGLSYYYLKGYGENPIEITDIPLKEFSEIESFLHETVTKIKNIGKQENTTILARDAYNHFKRKSNLFG